MKIGPAGDLPSSSSAGCRNSNGTPWQACRHALYFNIGDDRLSLTDGKKLEKAVGEAAIIIKAVEHHGETLKKELVTRGNLREMDLRLMAEIEKTKAEIRRAKEEPRDGSSGSWWRRGCHHRRHRSPGQITPRFWENPHRFAAAAAFAAEEQLHFETALGLAFEPAETNALISLVTGS